MTSQSDTATPALADFIARARSGLLGELPVEIADPFVEGTSMPVQQHPAAVLIPIVARREGPSVLFTVRAASLPRHAGQISFPGGRVDPGDADAKAAALREANEEIGLAPAQVQVLGFLDIYLAASGFRVTPVVGLIEPDAPLALNPGEVDEVFEVPLAHLMAPDGHRLDFDHPRGQIRRYYVMTYGERRIWGITAGILRNLYDRLYA